MIEAKSTPHPSTVPDHYIPCPNLRLIRMKDGSLSLEQLWVPHDSWVMYPQDFHRCGIWAQVPEEKNP